MFGNQSTDHNTSIPLDDALMSDFAMFSLKAPSLLSFDARRIEQPESPHGVYGVGIIPSGTQMRTIPDEIVPTLLTPRRFVWI